MPPLASLKREIAAIRKAATAAGPQADHLVEITWGDHCRTIPLAHAEYDTIQDLGLALDDETLAAVEAIAAGTHANPEQLEQLVGTELFTLLMDAVK